MREVGGVGNGRRAWRDSVSQWEAQVGGGGDRQRARYVTRRADRVRATGVTMRRHRLFKQSEEVARAEGRWAGDCVGLALFGLWWQRSARSCFSPAMAVGRKGPLWREIAEFKWVSRALRPAGPLFHLSGWRVLRAGARFPAQAGPQEWSVRHGRCRVLSQPQHPDQSEDPGKV